MLGKRIMLGIALVTFAVVLGVGLAAKPVINDDADPGGLNLLFVGNSLTFQNSMPAMVCEMIKSGTGKRPRVLQVAKPGWTLVEHWNDKVVQQIMKERGPWDYVVLQDGSGMPLQHPDVLLKAASDFASEAKDNHIKPVLFETWSDATQRKQQQIYSDVYLKASQELDIPVVRVGDAFWTARERCPDIVCYAEDGHHPGTSGTYLGACMFYKFFTRQSPVGLPAKVIYTSPKTDRHYALAELTPENAKALQMVADEAVQ